MMRIANSTPLAGLFHIPLANPTGYTSNMLQRELFTRIVLFYYYAQLLID